MTRSLDLGCGPVPKNPFNADEVHGIDVRDDMAAHILKADLVIEPIPHPDSSFEYITAHGFIQRIPRLLYVMQPRNPFRALDFDSLTLRGAIHGIKGNFLVMRQACRGPHLLTVMQRLHALLEVVE